MAETVVCPSCSGDGKQWYVGRDGEYNQAACSTCGDGMVGSEGSGRISRSSQQRDKAARRGGRR